MRANNALTPEEVEEGWVLTCQSLPLGQVVTVEYEVLVIWFRARARPTRSR